MATVTVEDFKAAMSKDWEVYHAYYETTDDEDMQRDLAEAGSLKKALKVAKGATDFFNEMQGNCY